jgi:hypothetical protein
MLSQIRSSSRSECNDRMAATGLRSQSLVAPAASRDSRDNPISASRAKAAFLDACRANNPGAARRYLLSWANTTDDTAAVRGLMSWPTGSTIPP